MQVTGEATRTLRPFQEMGLRLANDRLLRSNTWRAAQVMLNVLNNCVHRQCAQAAFLIWRDPLPLKRRHDITVDTDRVTWSTRKMCFIPRSEQCTQAEESRIWRNYAAYPAAAWYLRGPHARQTNRQPSWRYYMRLLCFVNYKPECAAVSSFCPISSPNMNRRAHIVVIITTKSGFSRSRRK